MVVWEGDMGKTFIVGITATRLVCALYAGGGVLLLQKGIVFSFAVVSRW